MENTLTPEQLESAKAILLEEQTKRVEKEKSFNEEYVALCDKYGMQIGVQNQLVLVEKK